MKYILSNKFIKLSIFVACCSCCAADHFIEQSLDSCWELSKEWYICVLSFKICAGEIL